MNGQRMSPLTALVIGVFGVGGVAIASVSSIALYGMRIIDRKADRLIGVADNAIDNLPDLVETLASVGDKLAGPRAADYAEKLDIKVGFGPDEREKGVRPVLTISNKGTREVTLLSLRVAALDKSGMPLREWTEIVATPFALDDEWRGPLQPGATRYVVVSCWHPIPAERAETLTPVAEISEIRVRSPEGGI